MPLDIGQIRRRRPQNEIHYFGTLGSTMTEAARLASSGARHGTVVLAEEQTAGIGRLGRSWISQAEYGIYCSVILWLTVPPARLPIASLLFGLATAEAIQKSNHLACDLRWPNDVLINERKVAGILAQLVGTRVVAGIGINVNQPDFEPGLRTPATSLRLESGGREQAREAIIVNLLDSLDSLCEMLESRGPGAILEAFSALSSYAMDRRVIVEESGLSGVTAGLDENGYLLIRSDSGRLEKLVTGGLRPGHSVK